MQIYILGENETKVIPRITFCWIRNIHNELQQDENEKHI